MYRTFIILVKNSVVGPERAVRGLPLGQVTDVVQSPTRGEESMSTTTIREEIENADRTFESTFVDRDGEGMADLYTEDGQLLPTGSDVVSGRAAIAEYWQGVFDAGITNAELSTVEVEAHGDTAIEVGRYALGDEDGETVDRGKFVVIWKKEDDRWKLHRDIWNTSLSEG